MTPHPRLIAIGGGGFTHNTNPEVESVMLAQLPTARCADGRCERRRQCLVRPRIV